MHLDKLGAASERAHVEKWKMSQVRCVSRCIKKKGEQNKTFSFSLQPLFMLKHSIKR